MVSSARNPHNHFILDLIDETTTKIFEKSTLHGYFFLVRHKSVMWQIYWFIAKWEWKDQWLTHFSFWNACSQQASKPAICLDITNRVNYFLLRGYAFISMKAFETWKHLFWWDYCRQSSACVVCFVARIENAMLQIASFVPCCFVLLQGRRGVIILPCYGRCIFRECQGLSLKSVTVF